MTGQRERPAGGRRTELLSAEARDQCRDGVARGVIDTHLTRHLAVDDGGDGAEVHR